MKGMLVIGGYLVPSLREQGRDDLADNTIDRRQKKEL